MFARLSQPLQDANVPDNWCHTKSAMSIWGQTKNDVATGWWLAVLLVVVCKKLEDNQTEQLLVLREGEDNSCRANLVGGSMVKSSFECCVFGVGAGGDLL